MKFIKNMMKIYVEKESANKSLSKAPKHQYEQKNDNTKHYWEL